jgi:hypothetical protein
MTLFITCPYCMKDISIRLSGRAAMSQGPPHYGDGRLDDQLDSILAVLEMHLIEWLQTAEVRTAPSKKQRVPRRAAKGARR